MEVELKTNRLKAETSLVSKEIGARNWEQILRITLTVLIWLICIGFGPLLSPLLHASNVSCDDLGQYLRGKVYNQATKSPMPGVRIRISGGDTTSTDEEGYFRLDLEVGEKGVPGSVLTLYLLDEKLGNDMVELVVPSDLTRDLRLNFKADRYLAVSGTVTDKSSGKLLSGVVVRVMPEVQGLEASAPVATVTDVSGWFWITLDRARYGKVDYIRMTAQFPTSGVYQDWSRLERAGNGLEIALEPIRTVQVPPSNDPSLPISSDLKHGTICITNRTSELIKIAVHKTHPTNMSMYEQGATVETKIGPGESPCFEQIPLGNYKVVKLDIQLSYRQELETYSVIVSGGKTTQVAIR